MCRLGDVGILFGNWVLCLKWWSDLRCAGAVMRRIRGGDFLGV
jgi:hypothetical protein